MMYVQNANLTNFAIDYTTGAELIESDIYTRYSCENSDDSECYCDDCPNESCYDPICPEK